MKLKLSFFYAMILGALGLTLVSCSEIQSGRYIQIRDGDSVDSLSKEFHVPHAVLLNANKNKSFKVGSWVFIPQNVGIVPRLMKNSATYGNFYSSEDFFKYPFLWPVPSSSQISSSFGVERWGRIHKGIDIPAPMGESFLAASDGTVENVDFEYNGYGNMAIIRHDDGLESVYGHASQILVVPGERVYRGQTIGLVGSTGRSTGPHLHFEVRRSGLPIDPSPFVLGQ